MNGEAATSITSVCPYRKGALFRARKFGCRLYRLWYQLVAGGCQDVLAHRALEFLDHRGLEAGEGVVGNGETVRLQMGLVTEPDEMRDEAQAGLAALQLAEQHVIGLRSEEH